MAWLPWVLNKLDKLDSFLSWWDRLAKMPWIWMGVTTVAAYLFNLWAGLTEQPLIIHVTVMLGGAAFITYLFTHLPSLLAKVTHAPFEVLVSGIAYPTKHGVQMRASIINQSPKNRMVLEFAICLQEKSGEQTWFLGPELQGITSGLGPQEKTEGMIIGRRIDEGSQSDLPPDPGIFLQVKDHISARRIFLKVPGSYPPSLSGGQAAELQSRLDRGTVRREQREVLASFFEEGKQMRKDYEVPHDVSAVPAKKWSQEVVLYLEKTFDRSYAMRFESDERITAFYLLNSNVSRQNEKIYKYISTRLIRLEELMIELRD